jgi:hypothetical protein
MRSPANAGAHAVISPLGTKAGLGLRGRNLGMGPSFRGDTFGYSAFNGTDGTQQYQSGSKMKTSRRPWGLSVEPSRMV